MSEEVTTSQHCLFILGMHRSGTSALARVLNLSGAYIAENLVEAADDNPEGFWEDQRIVELQDKILFSLGRTWDSVGAIDNSDFDKPELQILVTELSNHVSENYGHQQLSVIKDPRSCLLLPVWQKILTTSGIEPLFIHMLRSPWEVAQSLFKRGRLPAWKSRAIWLRYVVDAIKNSSRNKSVLVSYSDLLKSPEEIVLLIQSRLPGLKSSLLVVNDELATSVRSDLQHNHVELNSLDEESRALETFYLRLLNSMNDLDVDDLLLEGDRLLALYERIYLLEKGQLEDVQLDDSKMIDFADALLIEQLEDSRKYAFTLEESVKSSENYTKSLATTVEEKDASIAEKNTFIKDLQKAVSGKDEFINDLQRAISDKDEYIGSLVSSLEEKKDQLAKALEYNSSLKSALNDEKQLKHNLEQDKQDIEMRLQIELEKSIGQLMLERAKKMARK